MMKSQRMLAWGAACTAALACAAGAQQPAPKADQWAKVNLIHYEVVGEAKLKQQQIPSEDGELFADVTERVRIAFDWDKKRGAMVGPPKITNEPARLDNLSGADKGEPGKKRCPVGKMTGAFEYFDVVEVRQAKPRDALELVGKRIHPETQVAEGCGNKIKTYKGANREVKEFIAPPDPKFFALAEVSKTPNLKVSADGKSIIQTTLNNKWTWTFTPTPK